MWTPVIVLFRKVSTKLGKMSISICSTIALVRSRKNDLDCLNWVLHSSFDILKAVVGEQGFPEIIHFLIYDLFG